MKFSVERDNLLHALGHAHRIATKTDAVPLLATALFEAADGRLALTATNAEIVARTGCPADVDEAGKAAIRIHLLVDILRKLPAGTALQFERDASNGQMALLYRRSRAVLPTLGADDFAAFGMPDEAVALSVDAADLARLLSVPDWVPDANAAYTFACGIHLHFSEADDALVGVAATRFTLAKLAIPCAAARALPPVTIPLRSCGEIVKLAQAVGSGPVMLRASESALSVEASGVTLTSKLLEGAFPDYARILPSDPQPRAAVAHADISTALDRVKLLADDKYQTVLFAVANGILTLSSRSSGGGEIVERIEVEGGEGLRFGIRAEFALDALGTMNADLIDLAGGHLGAPVVMRPAAGGSVLAMIMPLAV